MQEAWNTTSIDLIDVVDRVIGEKNLKCVLNLGKSFFFSLPLLPLFFSFSSLTHLLFFLPLPSPLSLSNFHLQGALDGLTDDPTYPLFKRGACGAAFEGDELILDALEENLSPFRSNGVAVMKEFAHPVTLPERLLAAGLTVDNLDVLKVDVDGFDLALARSVLEAGFRPKVKNERGRETSSFQLDFFFSSSSFFPLTF